MTLYFACGRRTNNDSNPFLERSLHDNSRLPVGSRQREAPVYTSSYDRLMRLTKRRLRRLSLTRRMTLLMHAGRVLRQDYCDAPRIMCYRRESQMRHMELPDNESYVDGAGDEKIIGLSFSERVKTLLCWPAHHRLMRCFCCAAITFVLISPMVKNLACRCEGTNFCEPMYAEPYCGQVTTLNPPLLSCRKRETKQQLCAAD